MGRAEYAGLKNELLADLLAWFTGSVYWNAGYRRNRARQYALRWPGDGDANLHGGGKNMQEKGDLVF